ncbi:hypothetical protein [Paraflavitalea pollutisoli]|uniref:hypothetical protein n=1 Tax=Paraflavitalea pollutisoli TaxID=3034143 RepID=UPI0023EE0A4A|nr:hypothetical protein [Paraflavitalea sp. H1-2-19X]
MKQFLQHSWLLMGLALHACGFSASRDTDGRSSRQGGATSQTGTTSPHHAMDSIGAVSWLAQADSKYYYSGPMDRDVYVYVQLKGNDQQLDKKRVPLNISLVLDRSGSMAGYGVG